MNKPLILTTMMLAALAMGCDDKSPQAPAQPTPPAATPAPQSKSIQSQATDAVESGKQAVQSAVLDVKAAGQTAIDQAKPQLKQATTQVTQAVTDANRLVTAKVAQITNTQPATGQAAAETFDYQKQVAQAIQYVKENKLDLADKTLAQVESRKASIPTSYHPKIESTRALIDSTKKASSLGVSMPRF